MKLVVFKGGSRPPSNFSEAFDVVYLPVALNIKQKTINYLGKFIRSKEETVDAEQKEKRYS